MALIVRNYFVLAAAVVLVLMFMHASFANVLSVGLDSFRLLMLAGCVLVSANRAAALMILACVPVLGTF